MNPTPPPSITLESISLLLDEPSLLKGPSVASLLPVEPLPYKLVTPIKNQELFSPLMTFMPEVFHRRLSAYSKFEYAMVNKIYRMVEMIRYNFSNGAQVTAKDILRHPLQKSVPEELLPLPKSAALNYASDPLHVWPLNQDESGPLIRPTEEIMQSLLNRITLAHRQKKIKLFFQTHSQSTKSLPIQKIEFDIGNELDWRIDFDERKDFKTEFKIVSSRNIPFYFYNSFALEPESGVIVVHSWKTEFSQLQERLSNISDTLFLEASNGMPQFEIKGENQTKPIVKYLRTRAVPVGISGESHVIPSQQSQTEIHLSENGHFYIQHEARVANQKNIARKGWSERSVYYLLSLSQGLAFAMNTQPRDLATQDEFKRDWDLALIKHLGIFQYVFLETLSVLFENKMIDGTIVSPDALFYALDEKIKILLVANSEHPDTESAKLEDLCSRQVLACYEKFIQTVFHDAQQFESFYSETGEVIMGGVIQRELRLLYEMLKRMALISGGQAFKKIRVPLLSRISKGNFETDSDVAQASFYFPESTLQGALEIVQPLIPFGFKIFLKEQPIQELAENDLKIDFKVQNRLDQTQINWFELSPKFFLMGQEVPADNILRLGTGGIIEYENKLYLVPQKQMPSLRLLEDFWQKLQKGKIESSRNKSRASYFKLPRSQTLYLLALRNLGIPFQGDDDWAALCEFYDSLGKADRDLELSSSIHAELKPYQKTGVQWLHDLYELRLGAMLADDMGLGKTLQTLCFLENLRAKNKMGSVLVVLPSSLVFNWSSEIEKFTPEMPFVIYSGEQKEMIAQLAKQKKEKVVIITYGLMLEHIDTLNKTSWNIVVFDEAQNIKNINSKRTTAARSLQARFKIALSGTPMENHYGEFYSLLDTLVPGCLGPLEDFRRQFVNSPVVDYELIQNLKLKIKPLILRRAKKEILSQLPDKQETVIKIAFEEQQKEIYRNVALSFNQRVHEALSSQGVAEVQLQMFTALLRLRQVCSDPAALPDVKYDKIPPKLETLVDSLKEIIETGESALVFTQFLQTLEHTEKLLKEAEIPVFVLHGQITIAKRRNILGEFTNFPKGAVLLMTLKTGGVGLNLTKASYVFHIEPWWNPAVENQATDRAHRMGQTKSVQVFKYIMHESLEEKIEVLKERKERKFQSLFTDTEKNTAYDQPPKSLSKEDFDQLIEL
jgi:SNF2 family DNA or RNA helicase